DGSVPFATFVLVVTVLCGCALFVGWRTRLFTVLSWALIISAQNRNVPDNTGADAVLAALLLWSMFLPLGRRLSVDARRAPRSTDDGVFSVASVLLVLQIVMIYAFNVVNKNEDAWWKGNAVMMALDIDQHATAIGMFLRDHLRALGPLLTYS